MQYIVHRRFKGKSIGGYVNIPALSVCEEHGGLIVYNKVAICYVVSENAHQFFARNDDGNGLIRGKLTQAIQKKLAQNDGCYQDRWDKIWEDAACQKYKRSEYEDYWLWNHDFFGADIDTLRYIATLVGAKEE